jgi:hypothetical protein
MSAPRLPHFVAACVAAELLVGCSETARTTLFDAAVAPDGAHTLSAYVIEPWFPQGPHVVRLAIAGPTGEAPTTLLDTPLAWDGVPFTKRNISLRWTGPHTALVCLSATDRPDRGVRIMIEADGSARAVLRQGC